MIDAPASEALRLVEAVIADDGDQDAGVSKAPLCVRLPGGAQVELHDVRQVALVVELLRALVARAC